SEPPVDSATYPYVWIWSIVADEPRVLPRLDTRIMIPAPRRSTPATAIRPIPISHVQFRDLLDPQRPDEHEDRAEHECDLADERVQQRVQGVAAGQDEHEEDAERQCREDPARDS